MKRNLRGLFLFIGRVLVSFSFYLGSDKPCYEKLFITLLGAVPHAFPGLLVQTEVMANFPEKYLIGRSCTCTPGTNVPGVQHKPVIKIQSLSRKPVRIKNQVRQKS